MDPIDIDCGCDTNRANREVRSLYLHLVTIILLTVTQQLAYGDITSLLSSETGAGRVHNWHA